MEIVYRTPVIISDDDQEEVAYARRKSMKVIRYDDVEEGEDGA